MLAGAGVLAYELLCVLASCLLVPVFSCMSSCLCFCVLVCVCVYRSLPCAQTGDGDSDREREDRDDLDVGTAVGDEPNDTGHDPWLRDGDFGEEEDETPLLEMAARGSSQRGVGGDDQAVRRLSSMRGPPSGPGEGHCCRPLRALGTRVWGALKPVLLRVQAKLRVTTWHWLLVLFFTPCTCSRDGVLVAVVLGVLGCFPQHTVNTAHAREATVQSYHLNVNLGLRARSPHSPT
jgi:hypothetical protein